MRMYAYVPAIPKMLNRLVGPYSAPSPRHSSKAAADCTITALYGVLCRGCTAPNRAGRAPVRDMPYRVRVEEVVQAMHTPIPLFSSASRTKTQPTPHRRLASTKAGAVGEFARAVRWSVPQP